MDARECGQACQDAVPTVYMSRHDKHTELLSTIAQSMQL